MLGLKQEDHLAVQRLPGTAPQGFQPQEEHQPLPIFMEESKETVEQLIGNACFFFRAQDGSTGFHAHGNEGEECINGIRKKGDHIHGQDCMGFPAGGAFQAQDLNPCVHQGTVLCIPQNQSPFISGMAVQGMVLRAALRVGAFVIPYPVKR